MLIHDLPNELLLCIFFFLTVEELKQNIIFVCRRWRDVGEHPSLYQKLVVVNTTPPHLLREILLATPRITNIEFDHCDDINDLILLCIAYLSKVNCLQALCLKFCTLVNSALVYRLLNCIKTSSFKRLVIVHTVFSDNIFEMVAHITSLEYITVIGDCWNYKNLSLVRPIINGENLKIINFKHPITDIDSSILIFAIHYADSLKSLKINAIHLTDESVNDMVICIHLKTLQLHNAQFITDSFILKLSKLVNLSSLLITGSNLVQPNAFQFLLSQPHMKHLKFLSLEDYTLIDDATLYCIGNHCKSLEMLRLNGCRDKFKGMSEVGLTSIIKGCSKLIVIDLMYTDSKLTKCFHLIPSNLPQLRVLNFFPIDDDNSNVFSELYQLEKALPQLKIYT